jgi:phosphoribosylamine--glycine ligase
MRVLLIGSGGREHALGWKLAQSPLLKALFIAPGNAGTARLEKPGAEISNLPLLPEEGDDLLQFSKDCNIDLVVIGPEAPLAAGLADRMRNAGLAVFGPSRNAAEIESSKAFAKEFMMRHKIPTARHAIFRDFDRALAHLHGLDIPVVIKASGLAAGKGVIVPDSPLQAEEALQRIMVQREFGEAGDEVIIEERLTGPEISLLAFTDGVTVKATLPAQDHKRVFDGDRGPNTGGMGAYSPVPICPSALVEKLQREILQPAVDGLRWEGRLFIGVLYAGLMFTSHGPRVIEFNCRFGDPETQVLLPLLESDLLEIVYACATGKLAHTEIRWSTGAASCVVLVSGGYPGKYPKGLPISGLEVTPKDAVVFHAGTKDENGQVVTAGGRVLGVTGWGGNIRQALKSTYAAIEPIRFEGMHYRKDIGYQALTPLP